MSRQPLLLLRVGGKYLGERRAKAREKSNFILFSQVAFVGKESTQLCGRCIRKSGIRNSELKRSDGVGSTRQAVNWGAASNSRTRKWRAAQNIRWGNCDMTMTWLGGYWLNNSDIQVLSVSLGLRRHREYEQQSLVVKSPDTGDDASKKSWCTC